MDGEIFPRRRFLSEPIVWWVFGVLIVIDAIVMGLVLFDAYRLSRQNEAFVISGQAARALAGTSVKPGEIIPNLQHYSNAFWKVAFDVPDGYSIAEYPVASDGTVDLQVLKNAQNNSLFDSTIKVRIAPSGDFTRFLSQPYTGYAAYRRLTVAGRRAIGYSIPEREADDGQTIVVDDGRNDREISLIYSGVREDVQTIVSDILQTLRLASREKIDQAVKSGWKRYTDDVISVLYPQDYTVNQRVAGPLVIQGAGGRVEIERNRGLLDLPSSAKIIRGVAQNGANVVPDEYFELHYQGGIKVSLFYQGGDNYQQSVLQEIAQSVGLKD